MRVFGRHPSHMQAAQLKSTRFCVTTAMASARIQHCCIMLGAYEYHIKYNTGKDNSKIICSRPTLAKYTSDT